METTNSENQMPRTPALGSRNSASKPGKKSFFANGTSMRGVGRQALLDVTNDSPIAGLAVDRGDGTETPVLKIKRCPPPESVQTPGTDLGMSSPGSESKVESSVNVSDIPHPEVIDAVDLPKDTSREKPITRALLFDSPEKEIEASISSLGSSVEEIEDSHKMKSMEDDDASQWSVQVNVSSPGGPGQTDDFVQEENEVEDQADDYSENDDGEVLDDEECEELCRGLNKVSVHDNVGITAFTGKHTRFVYNSDDEIEREEVISELPPSPSQVRLKGLPTPKGKHLRFPEEDGDSENTSN